MRFVFRLLTAREPTPTESNLLLTLYAEQRALFEKEPEMAAKLIAIGERKPDPALSPTELATATILAQTVLNLDAAIWKR